jgi:hypothetical protein
VTDGAIGVLAQADIVDYNLLVSDPPAGTSTFSLSCCKFFRFSGSDLSATATQLVFNFSGADNGVVLIADPNLDFEVCCLTSGEASRPSSFCRGDGETLTFVTSFFVFNFQIGSAARATPEPGSLALLGKAISVWVSSIPNYLSL